MKNILCFFLFKKNLVFQIFIKHRIDNFKERLKNKCKLNTWHSWDDLIAFYLFAKKKSLIKDKNLKKLSQLYLHSCIISDNFLVNNWLIFFLEVFFFQRTKKLLFLEKLCEGSLYSFSRIYKGTIFSVWEHKKYSHEFFYNFWRLWKSKHRSRVKEDINVSFLDYSKKVYMHKLYINYWLKLIDIKHKLLRMSTSRWPSRLISYFIVELKNPQNEVITKNKSLLVSPKYASSSLHKNIDVGVSRYEYQFLRKNRVYNKGRYSRTRQNYRTGVYMCVYLSLTVIFGLYFIFYRFSFSFTHLWWLYVYFIFSFFAPKIIQNRLYEPSTLIRSAVSFIIWIVSIIKSIKFSWIKSTTKSTIKSTIELIIKFIK